MNSVAGAASSGDAALGRLTETQAGLIRALDGGEVVAIERAVKDFAAALAAVRAVPAWAATADTGHAVGVALQLIDSAAARTNFLADQAHRRLDALVRARGDAPRIGYTRMAQGYA